VNASRMGRGLSIMPVGAPPEGAHGEVGDGGDGGQGDG